MGDGEGHKKKKQKQTNDIGHAEPGKCYLVESEWSKLICLHHDNIASSYRSPPHANTTPLPANKNVSQYLLREFLQVDLDQK